MIPVLNQMVSQWENSKGKDASELKEECIELATAVLAKWPSIGPTWGSPRKSDNREFLETLASLDEPKLIGDFLGDVLVKDHSADPGESLPAICEQFGWSTYQEQLLKVMKSTAIETIKRNVRLLERICLAKPRKKEGWSDLSALLFQSLVPTIEAIENRISPQEWRIAAKDRAEILTGLSRSLIAAGQFELLEVREPYPGFAEQVFAEGSTHAGSFKPRALAQKERR